jgi:tetratricopeptide (TPR) repeat protein
MEARSSGPAEEAKDSPALIEAKALYKEGKVAFETGDYEDALALWKQAFRKVDDRPEFQTIRHTLVYDISEAHVRVYEVGRDLTNLRKAKTLLEQYLANHVKLYGDDASARSDRAATETRLSEIQSMLEEAEAEAPPAPRPGKRGAKKTAAPDDPVTNAKLARMREIQRDPELYRKDKRYKNMTIAGAVLTSVGGLAALPIVGGGALQTGGWATVGGGAILLAAGIPLLVVGVTRGKKLRAPQPLPEAAPVSVLPWGGPRSGGVTLAIRY